MNLNSMNLRKRSVKYFKKSLAESKLTYFWMDYLKHLLTFVHFDLYSVRF